MSVSVLKRSPFIYSTDLVVVQLMLLLLLVVMALLWAFCCKKHRTGVRAEFFFPFFKE